MEIPIFKSTRNTRPLLPGSLRYIRSDLPTEVTEEEREWLLANGITTVLDLRTPEEQGRERCPLMDDGRFSYHTRTVTGGDRLPATPDEVSLSYIGMVDEGMRAIIDLLLTAKTGALYFCRAGKDRTGVVSAILLHKLGFPTSYIVEDYMRSRENWEPLLREYAKQDPGIDLRVILPERQYIEELLSWYAAYEKNG